MNISHDLRRENGLLSFPHLYLRVFLLKSLLWKNKAWLKTFIVWKKVMCLALRHVKVLSQKGKTMYYVLCLKSGKGRGILSSNRRETWGLLAFLLDTHPLVRSQFIYFSLWGIQVLFYAMLKLGNMPKYGEVMSNFS